MIDIAFCCLLYNSLGFNSPACVFCAIQLATNVFWSSHPHIQFLSATNEPEQSQHTRPSYQAKHAEEHP